MVGWMASTHIYTHDIVNLFIQEMVPCRVRYWNTASRTVVVV